MTPRATVIVPTFNHGPLLRLAVESARRQSEPRLEIIIIGDGATPPTTAAAEALAREDSRVRFIAFPKDSSKGERYRHEIVQAASGDIVCYLADDDVWLPGHVATMLEQLAGATPADFAITLMVRALPDGTLTLGPAGFVDLSRPHHRRLFAQPTSGFATGISAVAHTTAFYRALTRGWRTSPPGIPTDGWMWQQCAMQPGVRLTSTCRATVLNFHSPPRRYWPLERRLQEMTRFRAQLEAGALDDEIASLERRASHRSSLRTVCELAWAQLHHTPLTGKPAMRLAARVFNRLAP